MPVKRPTLDDPMYSQKNPHQVFLLVFSLVSAAPLMWNGQSGVPAMDRALNDLAVQAWGGCLLFGSIMALVGQWWRGHTWNGLVIERSGLGLVGTGAIIYSMVIWFSASNVSGGPRFAAAITMAYGLDCLWRCGQITRRLRWIKALITEVNHDQ